MIRINLLPVKAAHRTRLGLRQLYLLAAVLIGFLLILIGVNVKFSRDISNLEEDIAKKEAEIARLEQLIGEVNQFELERARLLKQLEVIRDLERGKTGPVKALDALATVIPKRVWITGLTQSGDSFKLSGYGIENADISDFMSALEKSEMFSGVSLNFTKKTSERGQPVYQFELVTGVSYKG